MGMKPEIRIGYWSSILSVCFSFAYSIPQLLSATSLLPHPQDLFWLFLPSLFLAPFFLIVMICIHFITPRELHIWTSISIAFAILYAACVTIVYFSQLTVIIPDLVSGRIDESNLLSFHARSFLVAVDCLGYFFMSLSTLFASAAFFGTRENKWLYRGLLYNGLLLPILILAFFYPVFYYAGALWMITFPLAMWNAANLFRDSAKKVFV
jgi:hypothetical protein